jgi:hypothetical protein
LVRAFDCREAVPVESLCVEKAARQARRHDTRAPRLAWAGLHYSSLRKRDGRYKPQLNRRRVYVLRMDFVFRQFAFLRRLRRGASVESLRRDWHGAGFAAQEFLVMIKARSSRPPTTSGSQNPSVARVHARPCQRHQRGNADCRCCRKRRTEASRSRPIAISYARCASECAPVLASSSARAAQYG